MIWRRERPMTLKAPVDSEINVQAAAATQIVGATATAANSTSSDDPAT